MSGLALTVDEIGAPGVVGKKAEAPAVSPPVHLGRDIAVRAYRSTDCSAVRQLCCDTGFLGNPVDQLFQDRELFADLFTKAYLEHESDWALIAEAEGRTIGYLLGSVRPDFDRLLIRTGFYTFAKMVFRLMLGHYASHRRSRQFIRWLFTAGLREQPKHPNGAAHLHLNLRRGYRGRGAGLRLWLEFEQRLRSAHVQRCYGAFFSHSQRKPEAAYARFGFHEYARCPTTLFEPEISSPVEVVCVSKELSPP